MADIDSHRHLVKSCLWGGGAVCLLLHTIEKIFLEGICLVFHAGYSLSVLAQTEQHSALSMKTTLCASNARKAGEAAHG